MDIVLSKNGVKFAVFTIFDVQIEFFFHLNYDYKIYSQKIS